MKTTSFKSDAVSIKAHAPRLVPYYLGHLLIFLGCLSIVLVALWLAFKVQRFYANYQLAIQHVTYFEKLQDAEAAKAELPQLRENALGLAQSMAALHKEAFPFLPLTPYLSWLPSYGNDIQAAPPLLAVIGDLGRIGELLFTALAPALESDSGQTDILPIIVVRLAEIEAELAQAEAALQHHQQVINDLDTDLLSPHLAKRVVQLKGYLPQIISTVQLARIMPAFLGAKSPQTYLILAQNSDELRPTGGYINTAGHIVFDQGRIAGFTMQDSYGIDKLSSEYPYPPSPLYQYMAAEYWVLRDAGWTPDFPVTAQVASNLFKLGQGISVDGVIAFDQHALPYLIQALEPVEVEQEQVTGNNVIQLMQQHWGPEQAQSLDFEWWLQRKSFMVSLAETVRYKFQQEPEALNLPLLFKNLVQALQRKHIQIALKNPDLAELIHTYNWDGALHSGGGDYLMAVDANVGFNKANALIEQRLNYRVTLAEDSTAQAQVNLRYRHLAPPQPQEQCLHETRYDPVYEQNMARCYWNYLRLLVPAGAQLAAGPQVVVPGQHLLRGQSTTGAIDKVTVEANRMSWGQLFLLPPGETINLDYQYSLPAGTSWYADDHWEYTLYLQKQAGTLAPETEVLITLPAGAELLESQPLPSSQIEGQLTYQLSLETDQPIHISYTLP